MILIVLGFDNTGKTTLANKLSEYYSTEVIYSLGPQATKEEQLHFMAQALTGSDSIRLHERFPPFEELVYGPTLRGKSNFTLGEIEDLKRARPLLVYARPPHLKTLDFGEREQMSGVVEQAIPIMKQWDKLIHMLDLFGWDIFKYDYTTEPQAWEQLIGRIEEHEKQITIGL